MALAQELGYIAEADYRRLTELVNATMRPMAGLIKAIEKKAGFLGRAQASIFAAMTLHLATAYTRIT